MAVYFARPIAGCGARYLVARNRSGACRFRSWVRCLRLAFAESVAFHSPPRESARCFLSFAESAPCVLPFAESAPCFLPFEESAVYVGDKFGPWPLDD